MESILLQIWGRHRSMCTFLWSSMASKKDHVARSDQKFKKKQEPEPEFNLEFIQQLGGTKADLELLKGVESGVDGELVAPKEDFDVEPVNREDLLQFIGDLQISKYRPSTKDDDDEGDKDDEDDKVEKEDKVEKKKELDDGDDSEEEEKQEPPVPIEKAKKNKNKFKVQHDEVTSTSPDPGPTTMDLSFVDSAVQSRKHLIVKPGGQWFDNSSRNEPKVWDPAPAETAKKLEKYAEKLLEADTALYRKQQDSKKGSQAGWLRTVLSSGTSTDKLAALTLVIQESPVHGLVSLDTLIGMVSKKATRMTLQTIDRLKELFISDLLPEDRKLNTFMQHPHLSLDKISSGNKDTRDKALLLWYYEDQLKTKYSTFIQTLMTAAQETVQATKKMALDCAFELLSSRPEQEKMLLSFLVNKLGDPDYKLASRCSHLLIKLVDQHPNMKQVVVLEVERLMYRPNMKAKAQYYAVCFLNQLILSAKENELASRLLSVYLSFFKMYVKKNEVETKMMSGLLAGVTRAFPYAKVEQEKMDSQINMMFKVLHSLTFNTSLQALMLLLQVSGDGGNVSDRYYTALYKKMLDPQLRVSNKQAFFLNLLFKSLKKDLSEKRVKAFVKRLLQVCCHHSPPFICGTLYMLSQLLKERKGLLIFESVYDDSDDEEHFDDVDESDDDKEQKKNRKEAQKGVPASSWVHKSNDPGATRSNEGYNFHQRNPLHCGADRECIFELERLAKHYHPTVTMFALNLLKGDAAIYSGDPLQDYTLMRFLDRFVYRNPKSKQSLPGTESGKKLLSANKRYQPQGVKAVAVSSEAYMLMNESEIPVDEKFLFKYFTQQAPKKKATDEEEDGSDVSDDEFDGYLDTYEKGVMEEAELDFAGLLDKPTKSKKKKRKNKDDEEADDDDDEEDDEEDLSDEEVEFSDDDEYKSMMHDAMDDSFGDPDDLEEGTAFSDDEIGGDFGDLDFSNKKAKKRKPTDDFMFGDRPKKKGRKDDDGNLFVAAEEFSDIIDKNMGSKVDTIGSDAVANRDNASVKQLKWEAERAKKFEGKDWRSIKGKGKNFNKGKPGKIFNKPRKGAKKGKKK